MTRSVFSLFVNRREFPTRSASSTGGSISPSSWDRSRQDYLPRTYSLRTKTFLRQETVGTCGRVSLDNERRRHRLNSESQETRKSRLFRLHNRRSRHSLPSPWNPRVEDGCVSSGPPTQRRGLLVTRGDLVCTLEP